MTRGDYFSNLTKTKSQFEISFLNFFHFFLHHNTSWYIVVLGRRKNPILFWASFGKIKFFDRSWISCKCFRTGKTGTATIFELFIVICRGKDHFQRFTWLHYHSLGGWHRISTVYTNAFSPAVCSTLCTVHLVWKIIHFVLAGVEESQNFLMPCCVGWYRVFF